MGTKGGNRKKLTWLGKYFYKSKLYSTFGFLPMKVTYYQGLILGYQSFCCLSSGTSEMSGEIPQLEAIFTNYFIEPASQS